MSLETQRAVALGKVCLVGELCPATNSFTRFFKACVNFFHLWAELNHILVHLSGGFTKRIVDVIVKLAQLDP